jgi:Zn-dependent metalloprotease
MPKLTARLRALLCSIVLAAATLSAQNPTSPSDRPGRIAVHATTPADLRAWDTTINQMVRANQLIILDSRADPDIEGRRHESLGQYHQGIPVYGGSLSRQTAHGATVSIIGTVFEGISTDRGTSLSADEAALALTKTSNGRLVGDAPRLVIFPTVVGDYRLAYRATMSDLKTYIVEAASGEVLWATDEMQTQSQVGIGIGALGDRKKISTTLVSGGFRTHDQLRPAPIRTFDTRGSEENLNRLLQPPGSAVDSDFSVDTDNTWNDAAVVDTHVHAGWTHDYLFKQVSWTGIDNRRGTITSAVHTGLVNNAFFIPPPFGADGRGMFVYGRTPAGAPMTTLDIVGHEMMHGVTHASLTQRTGTGLLGILFTDRFGPTTATSGGSTFSCDTTEAVFSDGRRLPLLCNAGRFVLLSNHPGAINEAFSDVFGMAAEFFHQPVGTGPLRADYKQGEDVAGLDAGVRAADTPASLTAMSSSQGPITYPDHASRRFSFLAAITQGSRTNPAGVFLLPWMLVGNQLTILPSTDSGGVHVNATILTHAFYLAIEGGRNATSGLTVQGVGAANRAQIERAFFRAMTLMMPNGPSMQVAAQTIVQAAVDLHGANSAATGAIRQAMQAVGLLN